MKKVLIVAYAFPPVGGAGVQRGSKFVKYLREFGWEPVVITVENPSVPLLDHALCQDLPDGLTIYRAPTLEPSYEKKQSFKGGAKKGSLVKRWVRGAASWFMVPDLQILWWPGLWRELNRAIDRERPAALFVTAPPFSCLVPTVAAARRHRLPVVVDFRDEWAFARQHLENAADNVLARSADALMERYVVTRSTAITAANQSYVDAICASHPSVPRHKGTVITNGFDEDDFHHLRGLAPATGKITLCYTGTVWNATSLRPFVEGLKGALQRRPDLREYLAVKVYGRIVESESHYFDDPLLKGVVESFGYLEHDRVVSEMLGADVLLLTLSDLPGAEKIIAGKTFEYMAAGRHVLAMVPEGETRAIITGHYANATVLHPAETEAAAGFLASLPERVAELRGQIPSDISRFSRRNLTRCLAEVLESVSAPR